jgi:beta-galactosidase
VEHGYVSAYDGQPHAGQQSAESWWSFFAERPWLSGGFAWTGFDYRGEPTPYSWPCVSSHFGIIDTCGFPKDNFYYYQSWWTTNIVLHLLPHWNWPGKEGQEIEVRALSNCEEVELFLNGHSLGKKAMPRNSHLQWNVKYEPGVLNAKGYNGGQLVTESKVETTGEPAAVQLTPDRSSIRADGQDLSLVTVSVTDAQGRVVPTADNLVHFALSGPGEIIGVGNGDPSCHEPDVYLDQPATRTGTMNLWWLKVVSSKAGEHPEVAEKFNENRWNMVGVSGESRALNAGESGVYRAHLFVPDKDLALTNISVRFGAIKDEGWVYVNGKLAGESHDAAASPVFNVRKFLHAGVNTIAVLVKGNGSSGGISQGVSVELHDEPVAAHWQRSVFNGLAQVIIQSDKNTGEIRLMADAGGLSKASVIIHAGTGLIRP